MNAERLFGVRDPYGFRPLCLGRLGPAEAPEGWVLASETPALRRHRRHLRARDRAGRAGGDRRRRRARACRSPGCREVEPRLCIFEFVYIARPDSRLYGREVHEHPAAAWASCWPPRPRSRPTWSWACPSRVSRPPRGSPGRSGIPYGQGLVKNRYIGRTFIAPDQEARGRRGAAQAQPAAARPSPASGWWWWTTPSCAAPRSGRSSACCARPAPPRSTCASPSPPWRWPCFYGIDTPSHEELLATDHSVDEIARHPRRRLAGLHQPREPEGGHRRAGRRLLRRLLHR